MILERYLWTEADYDAMGWHDNLIYQMRLTQDLELDIDYILVWNQPELPGLSYTFWIAPATLVFHSPKYLSSEQLLSTDIPVEIDNVYKTDTKQGTHWRVETRGGTLNFISSGYTQFIRQPPFFKFGQSIDYEERYGTCLERTIAQHNPNRDREDIVSRHKQDIIAYEIVKKRHLARIEKERLEQTKREGKLSLKSYLLQKRELENRLLQYNELLKDSRFM